MMAQPRRLDESNQWRSPLNPFQGPPYDALYACSESCHVRICTFAVLEGTNKDWIMGWRMICDTLPYFPVPVKIMPYTYVYENPTFFARTSGSVYQTGSTDDTCACSSSAISCQRGHVAIVPSTICSKRYVLLAR